MHTDLSNTEQLKAIVDDMAMGDSISMAKSQLIDNGSPGSTSYNCYLLNWRAAQLGGDVEIDLGFQKERAKATIIERQDKSRLHSKEIYINTPPPPVKTSTNNSNTETYKKANKISVKKGDIVRLTDDRSGEITKNSSNQSIEITFENGEKEIKTINDIKEKIV